MANVEKRILCPDLVAGSSLVEQTEAKADAQLEERKAGTDEMHETRRTRAQRIDGEARRGRMPKCKTVRVWQDGTFHARRVAEGTRAMPCVMEPRGRSRLPGHRGPPNAQLPMLATASDSERGHAITAARRVFQQARS